MSLNMKFFFLKASLIQIRRKIKENAKDMTNDIVTVELLSYYYAKVGQ